MAPVGKERVELYKKFEPTGALLDAAPRHIQGITPTRLVLGEKTSETMWEVLCSSTGSATKKLLESLKEKTMAEQRSLLDDHSKLEVLGSLGEYKVGSEGAKEI